jgi:hypothetical protein
MRRRVRKFWADTTPRDPEQHFKRGGEGDPYGHFEPQDRFYTKTEYKNADEDKQ